MDKGELGGKPGSLFCPRNVTANNYEDNISKTTNITIRELDAELTHFMKRWNANYSGPSNETGSQNLDVPVRSVSLPINASGQLHYVQGVEDHGEITRTGSVFVYPPGLKKKKNSEMLECYVVRYQHDGGFQDNLGCMGLTRDKKRMVYYKNENLYLGDVKLRPIGISPWLPPKRRRQLMDRIFQSQPTTLQDFLFVQLLIRMTVDGDLAPRKKATVETFPVWHADDCNAQPTVEIWAVVLMFALIVGLLIAVVVLRYAAHRMIPCEIVGEDNIVRVWSREKSDSKRDSGATWLQIEQIEDGQRVTASVYEPRSARCNYSIPFDNVTGTTQEINLYTY